MHILDLRKQDQGFHITNHVQNKHCSHRLGYVDDKGKRLNLCPNGKRRVNVIGQSLGHVIQIHLDRSALQSYNYLIEYQGTLANPFTFILQIINFRSFLLCLIYNI